MGMLPCQEVQHNCPHANRREVSRTLLLHVIVAVPLSSVAVSSSSACSILRGSDVLLRVSYFSLYLYIPRLWASITLLLIVYTRWQVVIIQPPYRHVNTFFRLLGAHNRAHTGEKEFVSSGRLERNSFLPTK